MRGEDGSDGEANVSNARDSQAAHPFMKMPQDRAIFHGIAKLLEEFGDCKAKSDDIIDFAV